MLSHARVMSLGSGREIGEYVSTRAGASVSTGADTAGMQADCPDLRLLRAEGPEAMEVTHGRLRRKRLKRRCLRPRHRLAHGNRVCLRRQGCFVVRLRRNKRATHLERSKRVESTEYRRGVVGCAGGDGLIYIGHLQSGHLTIPRSSEAVEVVRFGPAAIPYAGLAVNLIATSGRGVNDDVQASPSVLRWGRSLHGRRGRSGDHRGGLRHPRDCGGGVGSAGASGTRCLLEHGCTPHNRRGCLCCGTNKARE